MAQADTSVDPAQALRSLSGFLDGWLAFQRWYRQVPSMAVGLSVGDETVFSGAYGSPTSSGRHRRVRAPATEPTTCCVRE